MRWSLTATGLLLLPLTHALPHQPFPEGNDETAPATPHLPTDAPEPDARAAPGQRVLTPGSPSPATGSEGSTLEQELSELQTLRVQLALLQKDADARAHWLATVAGPTAPPSSSSSSSLADCDGPVCILRTVLRKAGYAAETFLNRNREDYFNDLPNSQTTPTTKTTIPLPPWRGGSNATTGRDPQTSEDDHMIPPLLWLILTLVTLRFTIPFVSRLVARYRGRRHAVITDEPATAAAATGLPTIMAREEEEEEERGRQRQWRRGGGGWGCFCGGVSLSAGWGVARGREGGIRLGEGDHHRLEAGLPVGEEKEGRLGNLGEEEGGWDEKRVLQGEERYRDEEEPVVVVEDVEGEEQEGEDEDEDEEQELLTLGEEIASFRDALALVEDIVAAEEGRSRERGA